MLFFYDWIARQSRRAEKRKNFWKSSMVLDHAVPEGRTSAHQAPGGPHAAGCACCCAPFRFADAPSYPIHFCRAGGILCRKCITKGGLGKMNFKSVKLAHAAVAQPANSRARWVSVAEIPTTTSPNQLAARLTAERDDSLYCSEAWR